MSQTIEEKREVESKEIEHVWTYDLNVVLAKLWYPTSMHIPFWGISNGRKHEFVMRQGGIISYTHKTDPEVFMANIDNEPLNDSGIYAPTEDLIDQLISATN